MAAKRISMWSGAGAAFALVASLGTAASAQVVLFAPGTSQAYIDEVQAKIANRAAAQAASDPRFIVSTRWADGGIDGDPISLTYSLVPDGLMLPGGIAKVAEPAGPSRMFVEFDQRFEGLRSFWVGLLDEVFNGTRYDSWGSVSGITFTRLTAPPDLTDPENPIVFDWDDGSPWGANGPLNGGGTNLGDIRIAAKFIDGIGGVFGYAFPPDDPNYPGEIVLDVDELWEDPRFGFRRVANIISNLVGTAIGLDIVCPANTTKIMEPIQDEKDLLGPQLDDIRGANALYGDRLENNDVLDVGSSQELVFDPIESLLGQQFDFPALSIDQLTDQDFFYVVIPAELGETVDIDVRISAQPFGQQYQSGPANNGGCSGATLTTEDARIAQNIRVSLRDVAGVSVAGYRDTTGDAISPDGLGYIDEADAGEDEEIIGKIVAPGTYFIEISSSGGTSPTAPQMYDLQIQIGNQIFSNGTPMDVAVVDFPGAGIGATYITNQPDLGAVPEGQATYTGLRAALGQVDGLFPSIGHNSLVVPDANTPNIRNFPQQRVAWPGGATSKPAVGDVSQTASTNEANAIQHATISAAAAVGNPEGVFPAGSVGPAFETSLIAASIATRVVPSGFLMEREALTYAMFSLADPVYAAAAGLTSRATVISAPFGFSGDLRGDTYVPQLMDAIVYRTGVPIVASTGNDGAVDQTSQCGGSGQNVPGGLFRGSRTVAAPASAYNVISVGAVAKPLPADTPAGPQFVSPRLDNYAIVPDFSGKGPIDVYDFTNQALVANARPGIDLVAPGTGYVIVAEDPQDMDPPAPPCTYMGHRNVISITSPNLDPMFDPDLDYPNNPGRYAGAFGTSISSSMTAGAIALLDDYALAQDPPLSISAVVIRAILLAGAQQQLGWTNTQSPARPQDNRDGAESVIVDENTGMVSLNRALSMTNSARPLDFAQGAGVLNLMNCYSIYRGAHVDPVRAALVPVQPGEETQDPAQTNPAIPTITNPPRELQDINPNPFGISAQSTTLSVNDLPPSALDIAMQLRTAAGDVPDEPAMREFADFGDSKLDEVNGDKSASGTNFAGRPPYKLPPNAGNRPGSNPQAPPPAEIDDKIIVGPLGWDHGMIGQRIMSLPAKQPNFPTAGPIRTGYIDYFIAFPFDGSQNLQAALAWMRTVKVGLPNFSDPDDPQIGDVVSLEQENLDLQLIQCDAFGQILDDHVEFGVIGQDDGGQIWDGSVSQWSNVEYFSSHPQAGFYVLRVRWIASNYDLFRNEVDGSTEFGLAWIADAEGGLGLPISTSLIAPNAAQSSASAGSRVTRMLISAVGSKAGDSRFNPAFDADRDGRITSRDVLKGLRFWARR